MNVPEGEYVDILGIRFPLVTRDQAVTRLLDYLERGTPTGVCFLDMSALNVAQGDPEFKRALREKMVVFNDGAGLDLAARLRGRPFPDNVNGTDTCPAFLDRCPKGTTVFLVGGPRGLAERAMDGMARRFGHLEFLGSHHGYLTARDEAALVERMRAIRPQVVLVGMGNPAQVKFIARRLDDAPPTGGLFLAVGGLFSYFSGHLSRAPALVRRARLEWLYIVAQQPHKTWRYLSGIPMFGARCVLASITGGHEYRGPGTEAGN